MEYATQRTSKEPEECTVIYMSDGQWWVLWAPYNKVSRLLYRGHDIEAIHNRRKHRKLFRNEHISSIDEIKPSNG